MIRQVAANPNFVLQSEIETELPNLTRLLLSFPWEICECPADHMFLTSDSPVVTLPKIHPAFDDDYEANFHVCAAFLGIVGFSSLPYLLSNYPPIEFYIPLSPRYALNINGDGIANGKRTLSEEKVDDLNAFQVIQSHKEVFSQTSEFRGVIDALEAFEKFEYGYGIAFTMKMEQPNNRTSEPFQKRWLTLPKNSDMKLR